MFQKIGLKYRDIGIKERRSDAQTQCAIPPFFKLLQCLSQFSHLTSLWQQTTWKKWYYLEKMILPWKNDSDLVPESGTKSLGQSNHHDSSNTIMLVLSVKHTAWYMLKFTYSALWNSLWCFTTIILDNRLL